MSGKFAIRVTPRSAKPGIGLWRMGPDGREELDVRVAQAPSDGSANAAVIELLADTLGVSRSEVTITSGHGSRFKRVAVPYAIEEVRIRLGAGKKGQ